MQAKNCALSSTPEACFRDASGIQITALCGGIYVNEPCVIDRHMVSGRTFHDHGHFVGPWIKMLEATCGK